LGQNAPREVALPGSCSGALAGHLRLVLWLRMSDRYEAIAAQAGSYSSWEIAMQGWLVRCFGSSPQLMPESHMRRTQWRVPLTLRARPLAVGLRPIGGAYCPTAEHRISVGRGKARQLRGSTDGGGADHGAVVANGWAVVDDGRIAGLITPHAVKGVPCGHWPKTTVAEAMHALALTGATVCCCGSRGKRHDVSGPFPLLPDMFDHRNRRIA
jgi:hypothetical protein